MKSTSFRFLWIGQLFANIGDVFYIIGLISFLYKLTESAWILALVPFLTTLFRFISGLLAPLAIDKYSLKQLLVYSQLIKSIILLFLCLLMFSNISLSLSIVFIFVCLISFLDGVQSPASSSILPQIINENELTKANSFMSIIEQSIQIIAWPVGAVLLAITNDNFMMWFTLILFICSLLFNIQLKIKTIVESEAETKKSKWESLQTGWNFIIITPSLRNLTAIDMLSGMANGVWVAAILYVYVEQNLKVGNEWWGYINTCFSIGMIFGGYLSLKCSNWINKNLATTIFLGCLLCCIFTLIFGLTELPILALVFAIIRGIPEQMREVAEVTVFQQSANDKLLAKVYAAHGVIFNLIFGGSILLLGFISDTLGVKATFVTASAFLLVATIISILKKKAIGNNKDMQSDVLNIRN